MPEPPKIKTKAKTAKQRREELQAKLPRKVLIFGKEFEVVVTNLKGLHGDCDEDKYIIRLHQNLDIDTARKTLFHETIHAALAVSGHKYMLEDKDGDGKHEEALVRMLEQAFYHIVDVDKLQVKTDLSIDK